MDLFLLETTMTMAEARAAVLACKSVSAKPVWVTFTCDENGRTPSGTDVLAALIKNPATDAAIADQNRDFGILVGERRTWLDLINDK